MGTTPKFGWNAGGVAILSIKPAISLKRGKIGSIIGSRIALSIGARINDLDGLEGPLRTLFRNTCVLGAHHEILYEDRPILSLSVTKM